MEREHYSDKGSHKERSRYHQQVRQVAKNCGNNCLDCPLVSDCNKNINEIKLENMPKDKVIFHSTPKEVAEEFEKIRTNLFERFESLIEDYEEQVEYIKDPENKMAEDNVDFERSVLIDHIIMAFQKYLKEK